MKDHVLVIDDSFRTNYWVKTTFGIKCKQGIVQVKIPYVGPCLELAVKRAKRWIRANGMIPKPPKHIILAMMAFSQADPNGFKEAVKGIANA